MQLTTLQSNFRRLTARECECVSQRRCWRFQSGWLCCHADWYTVADVSKDRSAFILRVTQSKGILSLWSNTETWSQCNATDATNRCIWCSAIGRSRTLLEVLFVLNCCLYSCQQDLVRSPHLNTTDWTDRRGLQHVCHPPACYEVSFSSNVFVLYFGRFDRRQSLLTAVTGLTAVGTHQTTIAVCTKVFASPSNSLTLWHLTTTIVVVPHR